MAREVWMADYYYKDGKIKLYFYKANWVDVQFAGHRPTLISFLAEEIQRLRGK